MRHVAVCTAELEGGWAWKSRLRLNVHILGCVPFRARSVHVRDAKRQSKIPRDRNGERVLFSLMEQTVEESSYQVFE
jgi:hypothetical protein